MNENYRTLLEAAFPSTIVRSWQMLPTSEKLSHSLLADLIVLNHTLTMDDRIKSLEILKAECKDLFIDSDLITLIDNQISMELLLYHEFIKPGPRIVYRTDVTGGYISSLDRILKISQEFEYPDSNTFQIIRSYIDAKDYEYDITGDYDKSGKLLRLFAFSPKFDDISTICPDEDEITINHFFEPGDAVFNVCTKRTGVVEKILTKETENVKKDF